jgi:hypothetical protein
MSDDHKKKHPCPDEIIASGAAIVRLRHACKSPKDALEFKMPYAGDNPAALLLELSATIEMCDSAALAVSRKHGVKNFEWAEGFDYLEDARDCIEAGKPRRAYAKLLKAHECWAGVLTFNGIEQPTNAQIDRLNARGNAR